MAFAVGVLVAPTGFVIRSDIGAEAAPEETTNPVLDSFGKHRSSAPRVIQLHLGNGVGFYTAFVCAVSYIKEIDNLPEQLALNIHTGAMALLLLIMPLTA